MLYLSQAKNVHWIIAWPTKLHYLLASYWLKTVFLLELGYSCWSKMPCTCTMFFSTVKISSDYEMRFSNNFLRCDQTNSRFTFNFSTRSWGPGLVGSFLNLGHFCDQKFLKGHMSSMCGVSFVLLESFTNYSVTFSKQVIAIQKQYQTIAVNVLCQRKLSVKIATVPQLPNLRQGISQVPKHWA